MCELRALCSVDIVWPFANLPAAIAPLPIIATLVAAWLVLSPSAIVYVNEHIQRRIPDVLAILDDV